MSNRAGKIGATGIWVMIARAIATVGVFAVSSGVFAQGVGDFYKGRDIDLYIGYSVGGAYDLYAG